MKIASSLLAVFPSFRLTPPSSLGVSIYTDRPHRHLSCIISCESLVPLQLARLTPSQNTLFRHILVRFFLFPLSRSRLVLSPVFSHVIFSLSLPHGAFPRAFKRVSTVSCSALGLSPPAPFRFSSPHRAALHNSYRCR